MGPQGSIFLGKTLDEAVRKGLDELGLSRAEVMITMLEEGSGGFLGFGARPYKVRISARPGGAIPEPAEGGERARGRGDRGRDRDRGRGERGGRGGRGGRGDERRAGGEAQAARGEGRTERGSSGGRGGRDERREGPRGERRDEPRGGRRDEPRGERAAEPRGERPAEPRGERAAAPRGDRHEGRREERRDERREGREGREGREDRRPPREERPAMAQVPVPPAAMAPRPEGVEDEGGEGDAGRRRRRRGRRGGRRRGTGAEAGAPAMTPYGEVETPMTNIPEADEPQDHAPVATEQAPAWTPAPAAPAAPHAASGDGAGLSPEALAAEGKKWTEQLMQAMGFECTVDAKADADHVDVTVHVTRDDDLLTGPKGEVRQAMQHLLNRMVNRGEGSRYHLQLEINDFWRQREAELETLARSMAEQALSGNQEIVSEYLNAQERRVIHVTLRDDTRVKTYALGNGMIKRIAVAPAGSPDGPRDDD